MSRFVLASAAALVALLAAAAPSSAAVAAGPRRGLLQTAVKTNQNQNQNQINDCNTSQCPKNEVQLDEPTIACDAETDTTLTVSVCAGASGAPFGISLYYGTAEDLMMAGGFPCSPDDETDLCVATTDEALGANDCTEIEIGDDKASRINFSSDECDEELDCETEYVFKAIALGGDVKVLRNNNQQNQNNQNKCCDNDDDVHYLASELSEAEYCTTDDCPIEPVVYTPCQGTRTTGSPSDPSTITECGICIQPSEGFEDVCTFFDLGPDCVGDIAGVNGAGNACRDALGQGFVCFGPKPAFVLLPPATTCPTSPLMPSMP
jgi:hypothetical protein